MKDLLFLNIPIIYYFIVIAFILPKIPFIGKFFNIINTAIHEFGHALFSLLLQGQVNKIELFSDKSGTTITRSNNLATSILVSLAGYPFAASVAYFCFFLIDNQYNSAVILGLSVLFFIMLIFWIRNLYGFIWVILFCLINALVIYSQQCQLIRLTALFYATMIIIESISSSLLICYLSFFKKKEAGDATNLAKFTHLPAFIWGLLFAGYSIFIGYRIYIQFIK